MTDFAADNYYSRGNGTADTDAPLERDLTTVRGAASWGLEGARTQRAWDEARLAPGVPLDLAQTTFRLAALSCAGVCAAMVEAMAERSTYARTWARAYRHLLDLADRADRARVSRAGDAT